MLTIEDVKLIKRLYDDGCTHGQIKEKTPVTNEQEFAINVACENDDAHLQLVA